MDLTQECSFFMYTIEDPCDDFTFVRDVYDCKLLLKLGWLETFQNQIMELTEELKEKVRRRTGIIPDQLQKCYNILLHHAFGDKDLKEYRIYVR